MEEVFCLLVVAVEIILGQRKEAQHPGGVVCTLLPGGPCTLSRAPLSLELEVPSIASTGVGRQEYMDSVSPRAASVCYLQA